MTVEVRELWDFNDPAASEVRFREALADAVGDEALILKTQIARSHGLRRDFESASMILAEIEPAIESAGAGAKAYYQLERGRSLVSATHDPESLSEADLEAARTAYLQAVEHGQEAGLDGVAVDALHMMAFVDTEPEQQIEWNEQALGLIERSNQDEAKAWEGSIRNNLGYAHHLQGEFEPALEQFEMALTARQRGGDAEKIRIAEWMIAWTLRAMEKYQQALDIQLRLEKACDAAGAPDPYVFEELEHLYRALGDRPMAEAYADKRAALEGSS